MPRLMLLVTVNLGSGVLPGFAATDIPTQDVVAPGSAMPPPRQPSLPSLAKEMSRFDPQRFVEERYDLTHALFDLRERLNSAIRPSPIEIDMLLDLAALHLSQRMLPEARSFLAALPEAGAAVPGSARLSPIQTQRTKVLVAALDEFDGLSTPVPQDWPDAALFEALGHIARADHMAAAPLLEQAVSILTGYPSALADPVLPHILDTAINSGTWDVARRVAGQLRDSDDGYASAAYRHLLGRAAEVGGDLVAAFDNHAVAAAGADEWAQRSRLALIDLGRATGTLSPDDARVLLTQAAALWVGGPLGLGTLQRLAALEQTDGRDLAALEVLADIVHQHPDAPEARTASEEALSIIETLYTRGGAGGMPLAYFVSVHRAIMRDFGHLPALDRYAEAYADHLAASAASALAAEEYALLRERLAARSSDAPEDAGAALASDRLRLKQAATLLQGGQMAEAETVLVAPLVTTDPTLGDKYNLMRAQIFAATDRPVDVLGTWMQGANRDYIRLRAEAAFAIGDWYTAQIAYEQLFRSLGMELPKADRINLLLAAYRNGDAARLDDLIQSFSDQDKEWAALAAGLAVQTPEVLPLRGQAARQRVENADTALRLIQATGGDTMP